MLSPFATYEFPYPKTCHVYLNGTQSIPSKTWTVVAINAVAWDTYGLYTGSTSRYITIPEDGLYLIAARIETIGAVTAPAGLGLWRNGSYETGNITPQNTLTALMCNVTYVSMCTKGDQYDLEVYSGSTSSINIGGSTWNCFLQILKLPYITKGF
jgi:hypothetical protein